jgi:hypothetical protein
MADDYAYTAEGSIYTDRERGSEAGELISRMVPVIQAAQRKHDFNQTEVLMLIGYWEQIGEILRTPQYHRQISWVWLSNQPGNGASSEKPSQILIRQLQRLRGATDGINVMARVTAFNGAQQAMLAFVTAFRAKLKPSDKEGFDRRLRSNMTLRSLSPGLQHI